MVQTDVECLLRAVKNVKTRDKNLIFKAKIMDLESVKSFLFLKKNVLFYFWDYFCTGQTSVTHYACGLMLLAC